MLSPNQSELLHKALKKRGVVSVLVPVERGGHGNFSGNQAEERMWQIFDKHLRGKDVMISAELIKQGGQCANRRPCRSYFRFAAFSVSCFNRNFTIRSIKEYGIGSSSGNWRLPFGPA